MKKHILYEEDEKKMKDKIKLITFYDELPAKKKAKFMKLIDTLIPLLIKDDK